MIDLLHLLLYNAGSPALPPYEVIKQKYNDWLKQMLQQRYDAFQDEHISCLDADIIPLDLLPNDDILKALAAKDGGRRDRQGTIGKPVDVSQIVSGEVAGSGINFIIGPPGSGKTTTLYNLSLRLAEKNQEMPLLVHVAEMLEENFPGSDSSPESIAGYLAASSLVTMVEDSVHALKALVNRPTQPIPFTLLVDGLDEVESSDRMRLLHRLMNLARRVTICRRIIVCSRPGAFENLTIDKRQFSAVLRVMPLDEQRSGELAEKFMNKWELSDEVLLKRVRGAAGSSFQGSPLLIYMVCRLAKDRGTIAQNRVQLYEGVIDLLLTRAKARRYKVFASRNSLIEVPCLVAYITHNAGYHSGKSLHVSKDTVERSLEHILSSTKEGEEWRIHAFPDTRDEASLLHEVLEDFVGILCQQTRSTFAMLHRTLQEFLVAKFLSLDDYQHRHLAALRSVKIRGGNAAGDLQPFSWSNGDLICSDWWSEVYRFAGLLRGPRWLAQHLLGAPDDPIVVDKWLAGIRRTGYDREDVMQRRLWHVFNACCGGPDAGAVAEDLVAVLAAIFDKQPHHFRRISCRHSIDFEWETFPHQGLSKWCNTLLQKGLCGEEEAIYALEYLRKVLPEIAGVVDSLAGLLRHPNSRVRRATVGILGGMGSAALKCAGVMESLMELMKDPKDSMWKASSTALVDLLSEASETPGVILESLVGMLNHKNSNVRWTASCTLCFLLETKSEALADEAGFVKSLLSLLKHGSVEAQKMAGELLGLMCKELSGREEVVESLLSLLKHGSLEVQERAVGLLGLMGNALSGREAVVEPLLSLLKHGSVEAQERAGQLLGLMGKELPGREAVVESLLSLLKHGSVEAQERAAKLLGSMGKELPCREEVVDSLAELVKRAHFDVRLAAVLALSELSQEEAERAGVPEALVELVRTGPVWWDDRLCFLDATSFAGKVVDSMVELLQSGGSDVSIAAVTLLDRLPSTAACRPGVVEALLTVSKDGNPSVREAAVRALGSVGDKRADKVEIAESLVVMLNDGDYNVRRGAFRVWVELLEGGSAQLVEALTKVLHSTDKGVRKIAAGALAGLEKGVVAESLGGIESPTKTDLYLQASAARVLASIGEGAARRTRVMESEAELLKHSDKAVRMSAATALAKIGKEAPELAQALDILGEALSIGNMHTSFLHRDAGRTLLSRWEAVVTMPQLVESMLELLKRSDDCVDVLQSIGEKLAERPWVLESLVKLLKSRDRRVRRRALMVLRSIGGGQAIQRPDVVDLMVESLQSDDHVLGFDAATALGLCPGLAACSHRASLSGCLNCCCHVHLPCCACCELEERYSFCHPIIRFCFH